jgi:hypothetical protein
MIHPQTGKENKFFLTIFTLPIKQEKLSLAQKKNEGII